MSLAVPIVVTLVSPILARDVTAACKDLSFRVTSPGGYASLTVDLDRWLLEPGGDLRRYATVRLTDARHAGVIWEGRIEDLGRTSGTGQTWRITALGPSALFRAVSRAYLVIDSSLDGWTTDTEPSATRVNTSVSVDDNPDLNSAAILLTTSQGTVLTPGGVGQAAYMRMHDTILGVGSVHLTHVAGLTNTDYKVRLTVAGIDPAEDVFVSSFTTSVVTHNRTAGTDWAGSHDIILLGWDRATSNVTATAATWLRFGNVIVRPSIRHKDTTPAPIVHLDYVEAKEVVEDLLGGGRLPGVDGANARIDVAAVPARIYHLTYPDSVTAEQVLADLLTYEPDFTWHAFEANPATGLYRFEWRAWPTTDVRYEVDVADGDLDAPGAGTELWNEVQVRWRDPVGNIRITRRNSSVPVLTSAGLTRATVLDVGDNLITSVADAQAAGDAFLLAHSQPANAGTFAVQVPVMDRLTGRMVLPHEILPGWLCSVRGVAPSIDALNATDRNGVTVFRVASVDYRASTGTATLGLDGVPRTLPDQVARLHRDRRRR